MPLDASYITTNLDCQFRLFSLLLAAYSGSLLLLIKACKCLQKTGWRSTLALTYGAIGVVYGDVGTSPLYVFSSTFTENTPSQTDVLGAMSIIFWTITLIVVVKYMLIVLLADDNGEGGHCFQVLLWLAMGQCLCASLYMLATALTCPAILLFRACSNVQWYSCLLPFVTEVCGDTIMIIISHVCRRDFCPLLSHMPFCRHETC